MPPIQAVVFDLDDTLYAERQFAYSGFDAAARAFAAALGDPVATVSHLKRLFDSAQRPRVFHALLAELGITDAGLADRLIETYRSHRPAIGLFEDAETTLAQLTGTIKLGVLTDGRPATQWAKIDALELRGRCDAIIVTNELAPTFGKPHPRAFEHMSTRLQILGERTVYVADNAAKDFVAPNELGWLTIQVQRPEGLYRDVPPPTHGAPRRVLNSLLDLRPLLT